MGYRERTCSHDGKNFSAGRLAESGRRPLRFGASPPLGACHFAAFHGESRQASRQPGRREKVPGKSFCRLRVIPHGMFRGLGKAGMPSFARNLGTRPCLGPDMTDVPWPKPLRRVGEGDRRELASSGGTRGRSSPPLSIVAADTVKMTSNPSVCLAAKPICAAMQEWSFAGTRRCSSPQMTPKI
jgi:hypothetical protein